MTDHIVLVSPSGQVLNSIERLRADIDAAGGSEAGISVVGWSPDATATGITVVPLLTRPDQRRGGRFSATLQRLLRPHFIGLNLLRLSPWDSGQLFWRAARGNAQALAALLDADIVVAVERDAIFTVWKIAQRSTRARVTVTGMAAALDWIARTAQTGDSQSGSIAER